MFDPYRGVEPRIFRVTAQADSGNPVDRGKRAEEELVRCISLTLELLDSRHPLRQSLTWSAPSLQSGQRAVVANHVGVLTVVATDHVAVPEDIQAMDRVAVTAAHTNHRLRPQIQFRFVYKPARER